MFFEEMKITVNLIWFQKIIEVNQVNTFPKEVMYKKIGPIYGPYLVSSEVAKVLNLRKTSQSKVNEVLKGNRKSVEGYTFWYDGESEYIFNVPDVSEFKRQNQLKKSLKHTEQSLKQNLRLMGFKVVSIDAIKGTETKITTKCCRRNCNRVCQRSYKELVSDETMPVCDNCYLLVKSFMQKQNHETLFLHQVRPELALYYDQTKNKNLSFTTWRKGSKQKIVLTCPDCQSTQSESEATTPNKYTTRKRNGQYYASFTCTICNSLKVKFPEIALEWDASKNGSLPDGLSFAVNKSVWWKCQKGHSWKAYIDDRTCRKSSCPQCTLLAKDSIAGVLLKNVIKQLFLNVSVEDEAIVHETLYRNDCVVKLMNGQRIAFEMQGDYWHYDEKKLIKTEHGIEHKDAKKIAANRASGDLVFLLNEYDFNTGRNTLTENVMKFAIQDIIEYVRKEKYVIGCDIRYNRKKCHFALENDQAYYINRYKQIHQVDFNQQLHPKVQAFVEFQNNWNVF